MSMRETLSNDWNLIRTMPTTTGNLASLRNPYGGVGVGMPLAVAATVGERCCQSMSGDGVWGVAEDPHNPEVVSGPRLRAEDNCIEGT
jgi:hypothetical protein